MLWTPGARNAGMEIAMMLKEVQVSPGLVGKVMRRACLAAFRAGIKAPPVGFHVKLETMRR
ncbi:hypothetical protein CLAM6_18720 [Cobetia sp. AM6]|nr:hypothetical protein CLAM6_18720 [Cobetia sp. AM6]